MDGDARLPPEPGADDEVVLRAAGAWPPDQHGYVRDPVSRELRHWSLMARIARAEKFDDCNAKGL